jgi:hypothetical protein
MQQPMYDLSVPMIIKMLENLINILNKAQRFADKKKFDSVIFVESRLIADMYPLSRQIQIGTDMVRKGIGRLANKKFPNYQDNEKTIKQLQNRITKTINFLKKIKPKDMINSENKPIEFSIREHKFSFNNGEDYLKRWILPHFFFHVTTAYNILRMNGVNLGKWDYTGKF